MGVQEELSPSCGSLKGTHLCEQPGGRAGSKTSIRDSSLTLQIQVGRGLMLLFSLGLVHPAGAQQGRVMLGVHCAS